MTPVQVSPPLPVQVSPPPELAAWDVLGKSALSVYWHLDTFDAQSIKRLAKATGRARSTVKHALKRLSRYHLVIQTDSGGWLTGPNDLESVANDFACDALAEARRTKHVEDRVRYRQWIELKQERERTKA